MTKNPDIRHFIVNGLIPLTGNYARKKHFQGGPFGRNGKSEIAGLTFPFSKDVLNWSHPSLIQNPTFLLQQATIAELMTKLPSDLSHIIDKVRDSELFRTAITMLRERALTENESEGRKMSDNQFPETKPTPSSDLNSKTLSKNDPSAL